MLCSNGSQNIATSLVGYLISLSFRCGSHGGRPQRLSLKEKERRAPTVPLMLSNGSERGSWEDVAFRSVEDFAFRPKAVARYFFSLASIF